jgi:hypothetical protein
LKRDDLALRDVVHGRREHINADLGHAWVGGTAIFKEEDVLGPILIAG